MTPLQAEMLAQSMALIGSVIAHELLTDEAQDIRLWQANIAREMRKAFRAQLSSARTRFPRSPRPTEQQTTQQATIHTPMKLFCHNNHSLRYGTRTGPTYTCPHWHKSLQFCQKGSRACRHCAFWGKEGVRLQKLFDYIHPPTRRTP